MPAVPAIPSTGSVSANDIRGAYGVKTTASRGYGTVVAGPSYNYVRYVPVTVPIPINNYYGVDPYNGVPGSGTISYNSFRGTRPSARFYIGAEVNPNFVKAHRYGFGDAFYQGYDSSRGCVYTEGARFYHPESGSTNPAIGSISHRSLLNTGSNDLWITGIQCESVYDANGSAAFAGSVKFLLFFESAQGNNLGYNTANGSFTTCYVKIGNRDTRAIPYSSKTLSTKSHPNESYHFSQNYYVPGNFSWNGGPVSGTLGTVLGLYNDMKAEYYAGTNNPCYIWFE